MDTFDFVNIALVSVTSDMQNNDACFDKAKMLYEGERFVDPSRCVQFYTCHETGTISALPMRYGSFVHVFCAIVLLRFCLVCSPMIS